MTQSASDSFRNVTRYLGQDYRFAPTYVRPRDPTTSDIKPKEQQGFYPITSFWSNSTNSNVWVLSRYDNLNNKVLAIWILLTNASTSGILEFTGGTGTTGFPVDPNGAGQVELTSNNQSIAITGTSNSINFDIAGGQSIIEIGVPNPPATTILPDANGLVNYTSNSGSLTITGSAGGLGAQNINFDIAGIARGSWEPTILGSLSAGVTAHIIQFGSYFTINGLVRLDFTVTASSSTGTGDLLIGNLPIPMNPANNSNTLGSVYFFAACTWPPNMTMVSLVGLPAVSQTTLSIYATASGINAAAVQIVNQVWNIQGSIVYSA